MRQIDHDARDDDARRNAALVGIRSKNIDAFRFLRGLENTQTGGIGILEDEIGATLDLRQRLLLAGARVIPIPDVGREDSNVWIDRVHAGGECQETALHGRKVGAANDADDVRARKGSGDDPGQVRRLFKSEYHRRDVRPRPIAGRGDINGVRILGSNPRCGVLEFEAVAEHQIVSLRAVGAKVLLKVGGSLYLDMAYMCGHTVANAQEALIGPSVPCMVGNRAWCEQRNLERRRIGGLTGSGAAAAGCKCANVEECGEQSHTPVYSWHKILMCMAL